MITGVVNSNLEANLFLKIQGPYQNEQSVTVVIDTGFDRFLTLPPQTIVSLGCPFMGRAFTTLADGRVETVNVYAVNVIWDGQLRGVEVFEIDAVPLIGMKMMQGYDLHIQTVDGGLATLTRIP